MFKSNTLLWGHFQILVGAILAMLDAINPGLILNAVTNASPVHILLVTAVYSGVTYWLRSITTKPLSEK